MAAKTKATTGLSGPERERFHAELRRDSRRPLVWLMGIFLPFYLAWWGFDLFLAPGQAHTFLIIRLVVCGLCLPCLLAAMTRRGGRHVYVIFTMYALLFGGGVAVMLPQVPDAAFVPYIVGLVMVSLGSGAVPTWPWRWPFGVLLTLFTQSALALAVGSSPARITTIGGATVILVSAAVLTLIISIFKYRSARREFEARVALEREQKRADAARAEAIEAKEQVESMLVQLQELDQQKTAFFQNVSHELRTPLTVLLAPLQALAQRADPTSRPKLEMIERNAHRLLRLVNQLLDFARLEAGRGASAPEPHAPGRLVAPIVEGFEAFARSKGLTLELRAADDVPPALVDPDDFDKILCNLLSNACKFTEPGGSIVVRVEADDAWVRVAVKDTGIGIAEADLPKVFERFRQVDEQVNRRYEGSGIGLALAKELAEAGGGRLEVQSERGIGSTFCVLLPRTTGEPSAPLPLAAPSSLPGSGTRASGEVKALEAEVGPEVRDEAVRDETDRDEADRDEAARSGPQDAPLLLVVEDNADMRALIADVCRDEFRVAEASDGERGLAQARELLPAVIVSDVMMPKLDGHAMVRRLRSDAATATIPIILLTAKAGQELRLEALEGGADDYLSKPFEPRELLARLRSIMRLRALELELRTTNEMLEKRVVEQAVALERARELGRYLPPQVARAVAEQGRQPGLERRRLTVFRLELRGFDAFARSREPEDVAAVLSAHLSAVVDIAFSHGATVERFVRDRVHGFFGAPEQAPPEQSARRALAMARDLRVQLTALAQRVVGSDGRPLQPTIALASGPATVGTFGASQRLEYAAVGTVCDRAEAQLASARPGTISYGEATRQLLGEQAGGVESPSSADAAGASLRVWCLDPEPAAAASAADAEATHPAASAGAATTHAPEEPSAGTVLGERYVILGKLGEGGMGRVYRARDEKLGGEVAIKLLIAADDESRARARGFRREVRLARLVTHRNVARIYDLGDWNDREFVSMEYLEGEELGEQLRRDKALDTSVAQELLLQLCDGLGAAHAVGVVHRDLKPSNIFLERGGRLVILDFGLAHGLQALRMSMTEVDGLVGTPQYMAPEQFQGRSVDERADFYAFGAVAFEMLTGERVFAADNIAGLTYQHVHVPPRDPSTLRAGIPPRLSAVILRCLAKEPADRFTTAAEIRSLLS